MEEAVLYGPDETRRLLDEFLEQLSARFGDDSWALVGIHRRGDIIAKRLRARIARGHGIELPLGVLDITLYRDDFSPDRPQPTVRPSRIGFPIDGAKILLIDDVFQTGRTIRAALNQLADFGRARHVELAVFVDRQMRELPICPDHMGLVVERPPNELVQLQLEEIDGQDRVIAVRRSEGAG